MNTNWKEKKTEIRRQKSFWSLVCSPPSRNKQYVIEVWLFENNAIRRIVKREKKKKKIFSREQNGVTKVNPMVFAVAHKKRQYKKFFIVSRMELQNLIIWYFHYITKRYNIKNLFFFFFFVWCSSAKCHLHRTEGSKSILLPTFLSPPPNAVYDMRWKHFQYRPNTNSLTSPFSSRNEVLFCLSLPISGIFFSSALTFYFLGRNNRGRKTSLKV